MMTITQALEWRYATKKFDATKKLTGAQVTMLLEAARLAPSSFGLQPWRFLVIKDPALREKIRASAWGQAQVTDASHLIILAAKKELSPADVDAYVADTAKTRSVPVESLKGYRDMMLGTIASRSPAEITSWNQKQVYIALGTMLTAAAEAKIDAVPMEGFNPAQVDEILGLTKQGLTATVLVPVGHRAADDSYANLKKVRFPYATVVRTI